MAYAASRYTEAKLDPFCNELFMDIDKDAIDFVPNYDNSKTEPVLLPTTFPNVLVSPNLGIAVGMACSICSFNLAEICDGTIALLKNPKTTIDRLLDIIKAPDFSGGAEIIYDREQMRKIYETGSGSFKMRAKYSYDKAEHMLNIIEIPYSSCIEAIMKKATDMIKTGKLREVTDVRDSVDLSGDKLITFDLRRDADPEIAIQKLFTATELENSFDCNFNILVNGTPKQLGVRDILLEWIEFRKTCVSRPLRFDLSKKKDKLHLLQGLVLILFDIDNAIKIIRKTVKDADIIPNLMAAFNLSKVQAEYVADIKLRNLNREYITSKVTEIEELERSIAEIEDILRDEFKLKGVIIESLQRIKKTYGQPRRTALVEKEEVAQPAKDIFFENYNCRLVLTKAGYFKKLSQQSVRAADEIKLKDGDVIIYQEDTDNRGDVLFFTDKAQIYRAKVADFELSKASQMGDYVPMKLGMDDEEHVVGCKMIYELNPEHHMIYIFENGKGVRIAMSAYDSKSRRRKISGACSSDSPLVGAIYEGDKPKDIFIRSNQDKGILIKSDKIPVKSTRTAGGNIIMKLPKKNAVVDFVTERVDELSEDLKKKCRKYEIGGMGSSISQLTFDF